MKNSYITVTDQFCGAGGSSQGVRLASQKLGSGIEVKMALNHWKLAIETHSTNFQDTMHDCTDISACDPRRYPSTNILITSPECTNHSLAKGKKQVQATLDMFDKGLLDPAAERSRATMWDVPRFAEYHQYEIIIVENVVDARKWVMFDAWLMAMMSLGYKHKCVYLNSMHCHPTPQSRDRMYVVFWKKGNKAPDLEFTPKAFCPACDRDIHAIQNFKNSGKKWGKYNSQYVYVCPSDGTVVEPYYYASFNAIDWSDLGQRIGDREKPLSDNTLRRIQYGLDKYGDQPLQVLNYTPGYCKPVTDPTSTITTTDHHSLLSPFVINTRHTSGIGNRVKSVFEDPIGTQCADLSHSITVPFIIKGEHTLQNGYVKSVNENFQTQTVRQSMALVTPLVVENKGQSMSKPSTQAFGTVTTKPHHGIVTDESFRSFLGYYYGKHQASDMREPVGTVTTTDRMHLISYQKPRIEDCYYRMIKAHEVQRAMAFDDDYVVLGNSRDKVKQCGNAVTPPAMDWLVSQCVESLS